MGGFLFLTIGMLFITGIFCLVFALNQLSGPQLTNVRPMPARPEPEEDGPQLTKLGRPIQQVKIPA